MTFVNIGRVVSLSELWNL